MTDLTTQNVESISRKNNQYFVRYAWTEQVKINIGLPVQTGNLSMSGKINISRNKAQAVTTRTREMVEVVEVSEGEAKGLFDKLQSQVSRFECGWTAHIVK
jgi:hypothetical protein